MYQPVTELGNGSIRICGVSSGVGLLVPREAGNYILPAYPGLIIKDGYWRWPERNLAGNAIDFCVQVLGLSFHDTMRQIIGSIAP